MLSPVPRRTPRSDSVQQMRRYARRPLGPCTPAVIASAQCAPHSERIVTSVPVPGCATEVHHPRSSAGVLGAEGVGGRALFPRAVSCG